MKIINEYSDFKIGKNGAEPINHIYFNPNEWRFHPGISTNTGERVIVNNFLGDGTEGYTIGDWSHNWTEIGTMQLPLKKNTRFAFSFWLNGGENDCHDEVCELQILYDNDYASRTVFKLNRGLTKPVKHYRGWYLFEPCFVTGSNEFTQLRFVAQRAPLTILTARESEFYSELPSETPIDAPQRSNIFFSDGYPTDAVWSKRVFDELKKQRKGVN